MDEMSTRGSWGIKYKGVTKETYNHMDSYPTGLGVQVSKLLMAVLKDCDYETDAMLKELRELFNRISMVAFDDRASEEQIEKYRKYAEEDATEEDLKAFYRLLRKTQYNPLFYYEDKELDVMNPNNGDNEFSYLIDLDKKELRVTSHRKRRVLTLRLDDESTICNLECRMIDFEDELEDY